MDVIRNAIRAVELAGLDFGAADVIVDGTGKAYTLEVNTAPWLSPYYAKQIGLALKYMIAGGKTEKIDPSEMTDWKKAIHPCRL
jgi:D-alanine-D-alanine ligase-like ATP-grasp enzyme